MLSTAVGIKEKPNFAEVDFSQSPFVVIWEITQACDLVCPHCRASSRPRRDPRELSTEEGFRLINEVLRFGRPIFVFTGGDPMKRPDVFDLVGYAATKGLRVALSPSATPLVTRRAIFDLKARGLDRMAVSLDGSTEQIHDAFRKVPGAFGWTMDILNWSREAGIPLQVNTTVTRYNLDDFDAMAELMAGLDISMWSVFFLVPTGRGREKDEVSPEDYERVFHRLYDLSEQVPFDVKTTAAPHFRRVVIQRRRSEGGDGRDITVKGPGFAVDGFRRAEKGVNDGNGFLFISHVGQIMPSGFLPISAGNVRQISPVEVYRSSPLFLELRDYSHLKGKCGWCDFRDVCGGSRARAYAVTRDYMAEEPYCVYQPRRPRGANDQ